MNNQRINRHEPDPQNDLFCKKCGSAIECESGPCPVQEEEQEDEQ